MGREGPTKITESRAEDLRLRGQPGHVGATDVESDQQSQKRRVSIHMWARDTNMATASSAMATATPGQMNAQWNAIGPTITSAKISRTVAIIVTESLRSGFFE